MKPIKNTKVVFICPNARICPDHRFSNGKGLCGHHKDHNRLSECSAGNCHGFQNSECRWEQVE